MAQTVENPPAVQIPVPFLGRENPLKKGMATTPVFLPGEFHGQRSLVGYSPWDHKESDTTKWLTCSLFQANYQYQRKKLQSDLFICRLHICTFNQTAKITECFKKQNLSLLRASNYLDSIYIRYYKWSRHDSDMREWENVHRFYTNTLHLT